MPDHDNAPAIAHKFVELKHTIGVPRFIFCGTCGKEARTGTHEGFEYHNDVFTPRPGWILNSVTIARHA